MRVIFNADDFGLSKGVNLGIIEAYRSGVVRSTTMMADMPGFDHAVLLAGANPGLAIGVHLTLTAGRALGGIYRTITDGNGQFFNQTEFMDKAGTGVLDPREIEREFELQIERIRSAGIRPDHFDSHHHVHMQKDVLPVFLNLAKKYRVGVRLSDPSMLTEEYREVKTTGRFSAGFYGDGASLATIQELLEQEDGRPIEIMTHPAYLDSGLYHSSSYNLKRIFELEILTGAPLKEYLWQQQAAVISYREL